MPSAWMGLIAPPKFSGTVKVGIGAGETPSSSVAFAHGRRNPPGLGASFTTSSSPCSIWLIHALA